MALAAAPLVSGHMRIGLGLEKWPENSVGFEESAMLGQLSLDFKPFLSPIFCAIDLSRTFEERGSYSAPGSLGELVTKTQTFSLGPRIYQELGPVDFYGGLSLTYLRAEQRLEGVGLLRDLVEDGLGSTLVLGITDFEIFFPKIGWGVEYRLAWVDVDALVDVQPRRGTWLLTTGLKF